jgi:putative Holliday junction resolvase
MRIVGLDFGLKRIGVAVSDPTGTLATPLTAIQADPRDAIDRVAALIAELSRDDPAPAAIVVGLPLRLDGTPHEMTDRVRAFAAALGARTGLPVEFQDERLSSHEAEGRLAAHHRTWQRRKPLLDAASAAVILQDYLDRNAGTVAGDRTQGRENPER